MPKVHTEWSTYDRFEVFDCSDKSDKWRFFTGQGTIAIKLSWLFRAWSTKSKRTFNLKLHCFALERTFGTLARVLM